MYDPIIVGAGPCGLSVAIETKKRGLNPLIIEKGCLVNSIYHFPTHMQFFSTPELLEIGGIPFVTAAEKPVRAEALKYYRAVAQKYELKIHTYERVIRAERAGGGFTVFARGKNGRENRYETPHLVIATGYYDNPNRMNLPGEEMSKVHHYFREAHPYADMDVLVIGGKNSAVEVAMELYRVGARVTMAYRRGAFTGSVKAWVKPVIESAINKGWIRMYWNTEVKEIRPDHVVLEQEGQVFTLPNDAVFAMTGYRPDFSMLRRLGGSIDSETGAPLHDPHTMETNVSGLYIAGVIAAGHDTNSIFIENGRFHGERIARHLEADKVETPSKG